MLTVDDISDAIVEAVEELLDGMVVSAEDIVNDLLVIPEVAQIVKTMRSEENRKLSIPKWAKESGVTLAQWEEAQEHIRAVRAIRREAQAELDKARARYVARCAQVETEARAKYPVLHGDVGRIVEANFKTWDDVPLARKARFVLEAKGKSEDEVSVLKNNLLSTFRGECVRRAPDA